MIKDSVWEKVTSHIQIFCFFFSFKECRRTRRLVMELDGISNNEENLFHWDLWWIWRPVSSQLCFFVHPVTTTSSKTLFVRKISGTRNNSCQFDCVPTAVWLRGLITTFILNGWEKLSRFLLSKFHGQRSGGLSCFYLCYFLNAFLKYTIFNWMWCFPTSGEKLRKLYSLDLLKRRMVLILDMMHGFSTWFSLLVLHHPISVVQCVLFPVPFYSPVYLERCGVKINLPFYSFLK